MAQKTYTIDAYNKSHENYGISLQIDTSELKEKILTNDGICSITKKNITTGDKVVMIPTINLQNLTYNEDEQIMTNLMENIISKEYVLLGFVFTGEYTNEMEDSTSLFKIKLDKTDANIHNLKSFIKFVDEHGLKNEVFRNTKIQFDGINISSVLDSKDKENLSFESMQKVYDYIMEKYFWNKCYFKDDVMFSDVIDRKSHSSSFFLTHQETANELNDLQQIDVDIYIKNHVKNPHLFSKSKFDVNTYVNGGKQISHLEELFLNYSKSLNKNEINVETSEYKKLKEIVSQYLMSGNIHNSLIEFKIKPCNFQTSINSSENNFLNENYISLLKKLSENNHNNDKLEKLAINCPITHTNIVLDENVVIFPIFNKINGTFNKNGETSFKIDGSSSFNEYDKINKVENSVMDDKFTRIFITGKYTKDDDSRIVLNIDDTPLNSLNLKKLFYGFSSDLAMNNNLVFENILDGVFDNEYQISATFNELAEKFNEMLNATLKYNYKPIVSKSYEYDINEIPFYKMSFVITPEKTLNEVFNLENQSENSMFKYDLSLLNSDKNKTIDDTMHNILEEYVKMLSSDNKNTDVLKLFSYHSNIFNLINNTDDEDIIFNNLEKYSQTLIENMIIDKSTEEYSNIITELKQYFLPYYLICKSLNNGISISENYISSNDSNNKNLMNFIENVSNSIEYNRENKNKTTLNLTDENKINKPKMK